MDGVTSLPASEEDSKFLRFAMTCEQVRSTSSKILKDRIGGRLLSISEIGRRI